jgi:methyl-accepting chemotaxis protein
MLEKLGELVKKVNRSLVEVGQISANIFEASRRVLAAAEVQADGVSQTSSAVTEINASIKEVSTGVDSLSLSASETSSSILQMAASIEEVALNAEALAQSVEEVSSSVVEMVASIKQISGSVTILMEVTSSTASSVAEMDSSIKQVEKNAMEAATISEDVRRDAETGKATVEATIAGINEIKRSSRITSEVIETLSGRVSDIGAILSVIDEVAEQTNLLALNAAIIAAQAGEHGKGFAVVADEIKELAERTSSSTREISQLIKGVQDETARAVEAIDVAEKSIADGEVLSQRSGEALAKIVTGVQEATDQVESIARATMEQAKGSQMIREAMEQVSDMIGQIASATREQSKGSDMIMGAAERMKGLTSQVRVSTKEQANVGNFIASSTENITTMIRQIKRACDEQTRGSEQIIRAVENIQESTETNLGAAKMMEDSVSRLSRQLDVLQGEMNSFKVENQ